MNAAAAMACTRTAKRPWIRGALLAATLAACQAGDLPEKDGPQGSEDVALALAALPEAEVLMASADGVAQIVRGDLGRVEAAHQDALAGSDASLREALPPILKAFRLENKDLELRKVNVDEVGGRHYRYDRRRPARP